MLIKAEVVGNWHENGRYTGYQLRFNGENHVRHLRLRRSGNYRRRCRSRQGAKVAKIRTA